MVFSGIMYWFMMQGKSLDKGGLAEIAVPTGSTFDNFVCAITENFHHPLALFVVANCCDFINCKTFRLDLY